MSSSDQTTPRPSRRAILAGTAATALGPALHVRAAAPADSRSPNEKLNIGIIGAGGRGRSNTGGVKHETIYALCDTNHAVLEKGKKDYPHARVYHDWRELLTDDRIDAVVVSTADHHHALASVAAMRAGKHVYCEKPLAHTVREARIMQAEYARRRDKLATQMGTQIHASSNFRRVVELIEAGAIGPVTEAHVWCGRSIRPVGNPDLPGQPDPKNFSWDTWLGPAAMRPYNAGYWKGGNLNWNRRWEFGNGVLGDMGSHLIDLPWWALQLKSPRTIQADGPTADPIAAPPWQVATWEHDPRGDGPALGAPVKVVWYHGPEGMKRRSEVLQPKLGADTDLKKWHIGVAFVGEKGLLVADYKKSLLSPKGKYVDFKPPAQSIPPSAGHHLEWTRACRSGEPSLCNFTYSGSLIEHNLLGNVAHRAGRKLRWDATKGQVIDDAKANALLTKSYRKGWSIEGPGGVS